MRADKKELQSISTKWCNFVKPGRIPNFALFNGISEYLRFDEFCWQNGVMELGWERQVEEYSSLADCLGLWYYGFEEGNWYIDFGLKVLVMHLDWWCLRKWFGRMFAFLGGKIVWGWSDIFTKPRPKFSNFLICVWQVVAGGEWYAREET